MFADVSPTPFDLRFQLFGFPVRVHPLFWLVMALLGDFAFRDPLFGPAGLLLWVACGFMSLMVHELGHAFTMRRFGSPVSIVLYAFGGLAIPVYTPRRAWQRMLIALAGPVAGFVLLGGVVAVSYLVEVPFDSIGGRALSYLFVMNLFWNVFNLFPIWPLDGGKVCREVCVLLRLRRPDAASLSISVAAAATVTAYCLASFMRALPLWLEELVPFRPGIMMMIFMAVLGYESFQMLQQVNRRSQSWVDRNDDTPSWR